MTPVKAPIILIVGRQSPQAQGVREAAYASGQRYYDAIVRAGGIPLMMPPVTALLDERLEQLLAHVDGLVFHGGGDIDPCRYGAKPSSPKLYGIVPEHDEVELAVMRSAIKQDLAVLGLCRGMQILNVALGGTLVQDIGTEAHWMVNHGVTLDVGSRLAAAFANIELAHCHSVHHQSLDTIAAGLCVVGRSADGMVEAVELETARWVVATQWHPEDNALDDPEQQRVFDELVRQATRTSHSYKPLDQAPVRKSLSS